MGGSRQASMGMVGKVVVFLLVGSSSAQVWDKGLCKARETHWTHNNHGYLYSGRSSLLAAEEKKTTKTGAGEANLTAVTRDWSGAGDWCQKRCMVGSGLGQEFRFLLPTNLAQAGRETHGARLEYLPR